MMMQLGIDESQGTFEHDSEAAHTNVLDVLEVACWDDVDILRRDGYVWNELCQWHINVLHCWNR